MGATQEKTILLINQMFSGGYLDEGSNVGHEVVNLLKDDNGDNYLYITSTGEVVSPNKVRSVIFVRNYYKKGKVVEIIAVAPVVSEFKGDVSKIKYGGVPVKSIFDANTFRGKLEADGEAAVLTFKADEGVYVPGERRILLEVGALNSKEAPKYPEEAMILHVDADKNIINTSMRTYFNSSKEEEKMAFDGFVEKVIEKVKSSSDWREIDGSVDVNAVLTEDDSFLEIIKKEDDELVYSNLLKYYFDKNREGFRKFASDVLGVSDIKQDFVVEREKSFTPPEAESSDSEGKKGRRGKKFIDIWIEDDEHIIVIENKIKSGINGIDEEGSQLEYYFDYAKKMAEENKTGSRKISTHFFIFAPRYNTINFYSYPRGAEYQYITYNDLYKSFSDNRYLYKNDPYFEDFLKGLRRHTKSMSELNQDTMNSRFAERIQVAKSKNK